MPLFSIKHWMALKFISPEEFLKIDYQKIPADHLQLAILHLLQRPGLDALIPRLTEEQAKVLAIPLKARQEMGPEQFNRQSGNYL